VKRTAILALGVLALGAIIYVGRLWAQTGGPAPATGPAPAAAQPRTRIALLNLSHVVRNYDKFKSYQEEIKGTVKDFQARETPIKTKGEKLAKDLQSPTTTAQAREGIEKDLKDLQRQMEDLKNEFNKVMGKKQGQQFVILYSDVRNVAERYAQAHNYEVVLHYNDAVDPKEYWSEANVVRKMQAGALMPLYYTGGIEISAEVIAALNASYRSAQPRPAAPATPGR
jgi:Skp family chaperone for outer membrane proteins